MHRFVWDFHAGSADGPWAPPGRYQIRFTVAGRAFVRPLVLHRDPRVAANDADLRAQYELARQIAALETRARTAIEAATKRRASLSAIDQARLDALAGVPPRLDPANSVGSPETQLTTLRYRTRLLGQLFRQVESADARPTPDDVQNWLALQQKTLQSLQALAALLMH
jgi:hypothetical protein